MPRECKHPTCGETCRRPKKERKVYFLPRSTTRIKPIADKRKEELKEYAGLREQFLKVHPVCQIKSPVCTHKATVIHHTKGRLGKWLLKVLYWLASCPECNIWIEQHDSWARENNVKLSKFNNHSKNSL